MEQEKTEITGRIIKVGDVQTFGTNGFRKCEIVIDTGGDYPQQIPVEFVQDKAEAAHGAMSVGQSVKIAYNLRGREYNGRYYVSVQGWRYDVLSTVDSGESSVDSGEQDEIGF